MRFVPRPALASVACIAVAGCGLDAAGEIAGAADASVAQDVTTRAPDGRAPDARTRTSDASMGARRPDAPRADALGPPPGDATPRDSGRDAFVAPDTGHDSGHDAGHDSAVTCPATPDCSNAACIAEGYACVPAPPASWTLANVDLSTDSACPAGYTASGATVSAPANNPAQCSCTCGVGTAPSCVVGDISVAIGAAAGTCIPTGASWTASDGACVATDATFAAYVQVTSTPPPTGGSCAANAGTVLPATGSTPVYVCTATGPQPTTGCAGGEVCTATVASRTKCVLQGGTVTCPASYPDAHPVGSSVDDTRSCGGACTCGGPTATCGAKSWTFYASGDCSGTGQAVDMDGACDRTSVPATNVYQSYRYAATAQGTACGAPTAAPTPMGSATLNAPSTLCCAQ